MATIPPDAAARDLPAELGAAAAPRSRRRWLPAALAAGVLVPGAFALVRLFRVLEALPNSPESYERHGDTLSLTATACGALVAAFALAALKGAPTPPRTRTAARTALVALIAGFVLWWLPIPFAPTRYLTLLLLAFAAARLAIASLSPLPRDARVPAPPRWIAPAAGLAGVAMAARVLLLAKLNAVAWAFAID